MFQNADSLYKGVSVRKKKLPAQLDQFAYCNGRYVSVTQAEKLNGFSIDPKWHPAKGDTRQGFVDVPVLEGTRPGSSFVFLFKGNAVGIALASGFDTGTISYTIDGGPLKILSLRSNWSNALHLPWYLILGDA